MFGWSWRRLAPDEPLSASFTFIPSLGSLIYESETDCKFGVTGLHKIECANGFHSEFVSIVSTKELFAVNGRPISQS